MALLIDGKRISAEIKDELKRRSSTVKGTGNHRSTCCNPGGK